MRFKLKFALAVILWLIIAVACTLLASMSADAAVTAPTVAVTGNLSTLFGQGAANQRVEYQYGIVQSVGGSVVPGGSACSVYTDANGNLPTSGNCTSFVQGSCAFVTVGSGAPIQIQFPYSTTTDLSTLIIANMDPPEIISQIVLAGPYAAGAVVTNPSLGQIGEATITWPSCNAVTINTLTANLDTSTGLCQVATLSANSTLTPVNMVNGQQESVYLQEDTTGGWAPIFAPPAGATLVWIGQVPNTLQPSLPTIVPNSVTKWTFTLNGSVLYGSLDGTPPNATGFPLSATANFNNYSGININQLDLTVLNPPGNVTTAVQCSGTCATTYTYEVSCLSDIGAETLPSASVTATNAATLTNSNFNTITWAPGTGCYGGYNVYGRISGSLVLLATVPNGTTTCQDQGLVAAPTTYTISFNSAALPAVAVWDLHGAKGWIDAAASNANTTGTTLTVPGFTTPVNHDLEIPVFGFGQGASSFTPPAGFSNTVNIAGTLGVLPPSNKALWGGTKDIAAAGVVATQTGMTVNNGGWAAVHFSFTPTSISVPVTVTATSTGTVNPGDTSISFSDPPGTLSGDLELICVSWGTTLGSVPFPSYPMVPATFNPLLAAGVGVPGQTNSGAPNGQTNIACYTNSPNISASGVMPPTVNKTGILQQTVPGAGGGGYEETLLGIQPMYVNSGNLPNGAAAIQTQEFPMPLTTISCLVAWTPFTCSTTFPVFAIKDITTGNVLCSTGTVTTSAGGGAVPPSNTAQFAALDQLNFMATTAGSGCTVGFASITANFKE